jgi:hypothetical protein
MMTMQVVTRYVANDGSEWQDAESCTARDLLLAEVACAMVGLKDTPKECNWNGYVQQDPKVVRQCKWSLFQIANRDGMLKRWIDHQKTMHGMTDEKFLTEVHPSWFVRMSDGCGPLEKAYSRLCNIDSEFREWNQPHYAMNPGSGEMVCVG